LEKCGCCRSKKNKEIVKKGVGELLDIKFRKSKKKFQKNRPASAAGRKIEN